MAHRVGGRGPTSSLDSSAQSKRDSLNDSRSNGGGGYHKEPSSSSSSSSTSNNRRASYKSGYKMGGDEEGPGGFKLDTNDALEMAKTFEVKEFVTTMTKSLEVSYYPNAEKKPSGKPTPRTVHMMDDDFTMTKRVPISHPEEDFALTTSKSRGARFADDDFAMTRSISINTIRGDPPGKKPNRVVTLTTPDLDTVESFHPSMTSSHNLKITSYGTTFGANTSSHFAATGAYGLDTQRHCAFVDDDDDDDDNDGSGGGEEKGDSRPKRYQFGFETARVLVENVNPVEVALGRTASDDLVRDFNEFTRRYDKQVVSPLPGSDKGAQGRVYRVRQRHGQRKEVVVKEGVYDPTKRNFPRREWALLRTCNHPHIIGLEDEHFYVDKASQRCRIILEPMDCDLTGFMMRGEKRAMDPMTDRLHREDAVLITYYIATALQSLHRRLITHLDVKPDNILLRVDSEYRIVTDDDGTAAVKIGDFGTAKYLGGDDRFHPDFTPVGTPGYRSPESRAERYNTKSDVFSLGCTLYFMLTGEAAFKEVDWQFGTDEPDVYEDAQAREVHMQTLLSNIEDDDLQDLLKRMLTWQYRDRLSMEHVLLHWVFDDLRHLDQTHTEDTMDFERKLLAFDRPSGAPPLCVYVRYMELSDIDEKDAVLIAPAYQDNLPGVMTTDTSSVAAVMARMDVPPGNRFGEVFEVDHEELDTPSDTLVTPVHPKENFLPRTSDGEEYEHFRSFWLALMKCREGKTPETLWSMYENLRRQSLSITEDPPVSQVFVGCLGDSRHFQGISKSRLLRELVTKELISWAGFMASTCSPALQSFVIYTWHRPTFELITDEVMDGGWAGGSPVDLTDMIFQITNAIEDTPSYGTDQELHDLTNELGMCDAARLHDICVMCFQIACRFVKGWVAPHQKKMAPSPSREAGRKLAGATGAAKNEYEADAMEVLKYCYDKAIFDEDHYVLREKQGETWYSIISLTDALQSTHLLLQLIPKKITMSFTATGMISLDTKEEK